MVRYRALSVRSLRADEALIDGEAVVVRSDGLSDFEALLTHRPLTRLKCRSALRARRGFPLARWAGEAAFHMRRA
jgi:hypothetical protein